MSDTLTPAVSVQLSPRIRSVLRIKSLVWMILVIPVLFVISTIGAFITRATANAAYLAYDAVDYDSDSYDRLSSAWTQASDVAESWSMFQSIMIPLFAVLLLAIVVVEVASKFRR